MKKDRRPRKLRPLAEAPATAASSVTPDHSGWLSSLDDAAIVGRLETLTVQANAASVAGDEDKARQIEAKAVPFRVEVDRRIAAMADA